MWYLLYKFYIVYILYFLFITFFSRVDPGQTSMGSTLPESRPLVNQRHELSTIQEVDTPKPKVTLKCEKIYK